LTKLLEEKDIVCNVLTEMKKRENEGDILTGEIIPLLRERVVDTKPFARKAALQALTVLGDDAWTDVSVAGISRDFVCGALKQEDVILVHNACFTTSVSTRKQGLAGICILLGSHPSNSVVQTLWISGALPLILDVEQSIQAKALEAVDNFILHNLLEWHKGYKRSEKAGITMAASVLDPVWHLLGKMKSEQTKCLQRAMEIRCKGSSPPGAAFVKALACAATLGMSPSSGEQHAEDNDVSIKDRQLLMWGAWLFLEQVTEVAALRKHIEFQFVAECYDDAISQLSDDGCIEFHNTALDCAERMLKVLLSISDGIPAEQATSLAKLVLGQLSSFQMPSGLVKHLMSLLKKLCDVKAPNDGEARRMTKEWCQTLLDESFAKLQDFVMGIDSDEDSQMDSSTASEENSRVGKTGSVCAHLFTVGEVALVGFDRDGGGRSVIPLAKDTGLVVVPKKIVTLVQSLLVPTLSANLSYIASQSHLMRNSQSSSINNSSLEISQPSPATLSNQPNRKVPEAIRAHAFVTLGKLLLRDQELAKSSINLLVKELRSSECAAIRSNIILILGDLCVRYTSLVDRHVMTIAKCIHTDENVVVRKHTMMLLSQLVLQDFVKWRGSLMPQFLAALVDENQDIRNLAKFTLTGPMMQRHPTLMLQHFIEVMFAFNDVKKVEKDQSATKLDISPAEANTEFSMAGSSNRGRRCYIYRVMIETMSDEQKLTLTCKLVQEILAAVVDGQLEPDSIFEIAKGGKSPHLKHGKSPGSAIKNRRKSGGKKRRKSRALSLGASVLIDESTFEDDCNGVDLMMKDTFAILTSRITRLKGGRESTDEFDDIDEGMDSNGKGPSAAVVRAGLNAAKGKLLAKISRKNVMENIVPVLSSLKHVLEEKKSPLLGELMGYFKYIFANYRDDLQQVLANDPQLAREIEYDLRKWDEKLEKQKKEEELRLEREAAMPNLTSKSPRAIGKPPGQSRTPGRLTSRTPEKGALSVPRLRCKSAEISRRRTPSAAVLESLGDQNDNTDGDSNMSQMKENSPSINKRMSFGEERSSSIKKRMSFDLAETSKSSSTSSPPQKSARQGRERSVVVSPKGTHSIKEVNEESQSPQLNPNKKRIVA
jgi:condensin-2 complex subunit D3